MKRSSRSPETALAPGAPDVPRSPMKVDELRNTYLAFFESRGHAPIPNHSLIPENDPTALFVMAGVHPLVPYVLGAPHPSVEWRLE